MAAIKEAVIDTNVLVALVDDRDTWKSRATELITAMYDNEMVPIFFDCVINETISVLSRRSEERKRSQEFSHLLDQLVLRVPKDRIVWASTEFRTLYDEILTLVRQTNGEMNFHDAFIAVVCRSFNVKYILSFDKDFDRIDWLDRLASADDVQRACMSR